MDTASTTEIDQALSSLTVTKADCDVCSDSGYLWNETERRIEGRCECQKDMQAKRLAEWKKSETYRLKSILLPKIDLTRTDKKPWYPQLPESGGVWLSGPADEGKTHAVGWMLAKKISEAKRPFLWSWFKSRQILEAWKDQYDDSWEKKGAAREVMNALKLHDVIVIDDIDKTGKITQAREEHLFDMIDGIYARGAELLVPSNIDLDTFCHRMENEDLFMRRDGVGPVQRRLRDICTQVKL